MPSRSDYTEAVIRTQIQLTEEQARRVKRLSREAGVSMAEVIRDFVERGVAAELPRREKDYARARRVIGRFPDRQRARDLAREHDRYLDESFR
jgi:hypothetical protein